MERPSIPRLIRKFIIEIVIQVLYAIARLLKQNKTSARQHQIRKVVHITPTYFSDNSCIGGGERYATALAQTMANYVETVLISFGTRQSFFQEKLKIEVYRRIGTLPDTIFYLQQLGSADIIHCHQYRVVITNLTILLGVLLGKRIFVTDHGGWEEDYSDRLQLNIFVDKFLTVSDFSAKMLSQLEKVEIIYGGVPRHFIDSEISVERDRKVVFVGRLLPHKGINYLVEAVDKDTQVEIIGRKYRDDYFSKLEELASGKQIRFLTNTTDDEIIAAYRSATVTVLPSVYQDIYGVNHPAPELLGLVLLESMACGTPVIGTNIGGVSEIVVEGVTGFVVPPNDPDALRDRINYLLDRPDVALDMGQKGRIKVLEEFTWEAVAKRCLTAYSGKA